VEVYFISGGKQTFCKDNFRTSGWWSQDGTHKKRSGERFEDLPFNKTSYSMVAWTGSWAAMGMWLQWCHLVLKLKGNFLVAIRVIVINICTLMKSVAQITSSNKLYHKMVVRI
jgi:hypothetical protein